MKCLLSIITSLLSSVKEVKNEENKFHSCIDGVGFINNKFQCGS